MNKKIELKKFRTEDELISVEEQITNIIREMGIPANIKGYYYIREAVSLANKNREYLHALTTKVYPTIAKKYNTTSNAVIGTIRHAITVACEKGNTDFIVKHFNYDINNQKSKPSNGRFISFITLRVKL